MSRWFRLDDDVINDPKILLLPEAMRWIWIAFLCIASKNGGLLPAIEIIALSLRVKPAKATEYRDRLVAAGLIDQTETGFTPHNWDKRQFKSDVSTERVKRFRQQERNVSETPPHTQTQTEAQTEKKKTRASALVDDDWPDDFRDRFWARYPHKVGKPKALAKLEAARKRGISWHSIMNGLERYIRDKPPERSWLNPETFLNQERWADEPATVSTGPPRLGGPQGFESLFQQGGKSDDDTSPRSEYDLDLSADRAH